MEQLVPIESESTSLELGLVDGAFEAQTAIALAKQEPDYLSALATPDIWEFEWPRVFRSIWDWVTERAQRKRDFSKLAVGLPRGFGKTSFIKLLLLYCILFTEKSFILILANTATLAENIISDLVDMLEEPNIIALFGDWKLGIEKNTNSLKKFGFRGRNIIIAGLGAGGSVRGLNLKNARPDIIVFEDVQSREDADSQIVSDGLYRWMIGTAMKAKSPKGCLFLFIANMYPTPHSILKKLKANSTWEKYIAGGILRDPNTGELESLWEALQPLKQLLSEYQGDLEAGTPEIFHAEVMNDENATANNTLDVSKIPEFPYDDTDISAGNFVVIDPATDKANSDFVTISYNQIHDGKAVVWDLKEDRLSPGNTIREALKFCFQYGCRLIVVEGNAYQSTLCYWFKFIMAQMGVSGIEVVDINSGRNSKNSRILSMFKQLLAGEIYLHPRVRAAVYSQAQAFNPLKTDNVDGILDCLTYAPRVLVELAEYLQNHSIIEQQMMEVQEIQMLEMVTEATSSPF